MVTEYCVGARPEYAPESSDEEDQEEDVEFSLTKQQVMKVTSEAIHERKLDSERDDRRLRRLQDRQREEEVDSDEDREARFPKTHYAYISVDKILPQSLYLVVVIQFQLAHNFPV